MTKLLNIIGMLALLSIVSSCLGMVANVEPLAFYSLEASLGFIFVQMVLYALFVKEA